MLINCDLGEHEDPTYAIEVAVMPHIHMANIACGFHAGNSATMANTLRIAQRHGVTVGAHPGYHDRANFGRHSQPLETAELTALLHQQLAALENQAKPLGIVLGYIKPHGALYNDMMANADIRAAIFTAIASHGQAPRQLVMLATHEAEQHRREAARHGISILFEAFADRRYTNQGQLTPRNQPGAVLQGDEIFAQVKQLLATGTVTTDNGKTLAIAADTLCLHGDNPASVAVLPQIRQLVRC